MNAPGHVQNPASVLAETTLVPTAGAHMPAYLARPRSDAPRPGLLVVHEAWGLVEHIRDTCRRLASIGFDALAPDLYWRTGTPDPDDRESVFATMFALSDDDVVHDLVASVNHLRALGNAATRVGAIGFCSGGRHVLLLATTATDIDVAIDCWGGFVDRATKDERATPSRPVPVIDRSEALACPILLAGGADDENPSPNMLRTLAGRLRTSGQPVELIIYDDAGHAFFADYRPSYRPTAAHQLWDDIVSFMGEHLLENV